MKYWIGVALVLFAAPVVLAETPQEKGLAIARESDRLDQGFGDYTANMEMILRNRQGEESVRRLRISTLEVKGDGDKSLTVFDDPADVKGTALLTFTHKTGEDDQWLYLPALKRVKRIASSNKSGPFMGSEFAYEDVGSQEIEKYAYKYLRDETHEGKQCFVIERYPVDKYSGYTRQMVWICQPEYRPWKIDFYDRKDSLLKTLVWRGYRQYLGKYWRADEMFMQNHQSGKSTLLKWSDYRFRAGLRDADFNEASLKRAR
ncbi:MAG: outer membrane lipoprotein-sorting protein [Sulfuricaulis sp.]|nr:outer membrane lipoprotein-sorting protein [Sulfuricaulis sp.]